MENPIETVLPFILGKLNPLVLQSFSSLVAEYRDREDELKKRCEEETWFSMVKYLFTERNGQNLHSSVKAELLNVADGIKEINARYDSNSQVTQVGPTSVTEVTATNERIRTSLFMMISYFLPGLLNDVSEFGTEEESVRVQAMLEEAKVKKAQGEKNTPELIEADYATLKRKYLSQSTQRAFEVAIGYRPSKK